VLKQSANAVASPKCSAFAENNSSSNNKVSICNLTAAIIVDEGNEKRRAKMKRLKKIFGSTYRQSQGDDDLSSDRHLYYLVDVSPCLDYFLIPARYQDRIQH
jgi:hypothetical protein